MYFFYLFSSPFSLRNIDGKDLPVTFEELTYGEVYYFTARDILNKVKLSSDDVFMDIGSGRGKMIFFASMYFNVKAKGVEIIPTFVRKSNWIASFFKFKNVSFYEQDMRYIDFSDVTVVYLAGTCMSDESVDLLIKSLRSAPVGARIITLSYPLKADFLKLLFREKMYFTWGDCSVYFHERISI